MLSNREEEVSENTNGEEKGISPIKSCTSADIGLIPFSVSTSTGCKPISDVQPGEFVRAFNFERGDWELCEVLVRHDNHYSGTMVTVNLGDDSVDATSGHPFWVVSGTELDSRRCPKDFRPDEDQGGPLGEEKGISPIDY